MKKVNGYNISEKEFKQLQQLTDNIYNTLVVVDYFVANQHEIEELYNLTPIIKNLHKDADLMNAFFINIESKYNIWNLLIYK